jgi:hypothetical protein
MPHVASRDEGRRGKGAAIPPGSKKKSTIFAGRHVASYTLRMTQTMRAMRITVPRMPPIYIQISIEASKSLLTHA